MYPDMKDGRPVNEIEGLNWLHSFLTMGPPRRPPQLVDDASQAEYERVTPLHRQLMEWLPQGVMVWVDEPVVDAIQSVVDTIGQPPRNWKSPLPQDGFIEASWMVFAKPIWLTDIDPAGTRWALHSAGHVGGVVSLHGMRSELTQPSIEYLEWKGDIEPTHEHNKLWSAAVLQLIAYATATAMLELEDEFIGRRFTPAQLKETAAYYRKAGVKTTIPDLGMVSFTVRHHSIDGETQLGAAL
jgi:hypothetical protein